jgi:hypothetical protein
MDSIACYANAYRRTGFWLYLTSPVSTLANLMFTHQSENAKPSDH